MSIKKKPKNFPTGYIRNIESHLAGMLIERNHLVIGYSRP